MSLAVSRKRFAIRFVVRAATIVFSIPFWLSVALIISSFKQPPTLRELKAGFPSKRADLQTILAMANQDKDFYRVGLEFPVTSEPKQHQSHYIRVDLPKARWDAYQEIYSRNDIQIGFERDRDGDVFIMFDAAASEDGGHATGYLHCVSDALPESGRFGACTHQDEQAGHSVGDFSGDPKYAFENLGDGWFAYDEGQDAQ